MDLTPTGQKAHVRFANSAIKVSQRFAYEQVLAILEPFTKLRYTTPAPMRGPIEARNGQPVPTAEARHELAVAK